MRTDRSMAHSDVDDLDYDTADLSSDSRSEGDVEGRASTEPHFTTGPQQPSLSCCIFGNPEMPAFDDEPAEGDVQKPSGLFGEKSFPQVCQETQKASQFG